MNDSLLVELFTEELPPKALNKLGLSFASALFEELVAADGFAHLAITHRHGLRAGSYPYPHADPFDRMLAAQAEIEGLTLLTRDPAFKAFPVKVQW